MRLTIALARLAERGGEEFWRVAERDTPLAGRGAAVRFAIDAAINHNDIFTRAENLD